MIHRSSATSSHADLVSRAQVHDLVVDFYREVVFDDLLGPVFDEVAEVDWTVHIPRLIDFWCRVLLAEPSYNGRLLAPHKMVSDREPFQPEHFDRWYGLWAECIDRRWSGPNADEAKAHAAHIGGVLARRLSDLEWAPTER